MADMIPFDGARVEIPIKPEDVKPLATAADKLFSGKYAWLCVNCGARALGWQLEPQPLETLVEPLLVKHVAVAKAVCKNPAILVTELDSGLDASQLLATPAAEILRRVSAMRQRGMVLDAAAVFKGELPAPAVLGSVGQGPWACPDYFRC